MNFQYIFWSINHQTLYRLFLPSVLLHFGHMVQQSFCQYLFKHHMFWLLRSRSLLHTEYQELWSSSMLYWWPGWLFAIWRSQKHMIVFQLTVQRGAAIRLTSFYFRMCMSRACWPYLKFIILMSEIPKYCRTVFICQYKL